MLVPAYSQLNEHNAAEHASRQDPPNPRVLKSINSGFNCSTRSPGNPLQALVGDARHMVQELKYSGHMRYVLVVLRETVRREQLEGLQPDITALQASDTTGAIKGVAITMRKTLFLLEAARMFADCYTGDV